MQTDTQVEIRPAIFWPRDVPLAALVDLKFQLPDIAVEIVFPELSKSLQKQQVVFVPEELIGEYKNDPRTAVHSLPRIERGFITTVKYNEVFCRYYWAGDDFRLRTRGNSEGAPFDNVFFYTYAAQLVIEQDWASHVVGYHGH